jgi:hypothetical protein
MGTNSVFLYFYEAEFIQKLLHEKIEYLTVSSISTFIQIDDLLSINNENPIQISITPIYHSLRYTD